MGCLCCKCGVCRTAQVSFAQVGPGKVLCRVEHSQLDAGLEDAAKVDVDVIFGDETSLHSLDEGSVARAALHVCTRQDCIGRSCRSVGMGVVLAGVVEVSDGAAVSHHDAAESPFLAEDFLQETVAAAAGLAFIALVCAHNFLHVGFLDY